MEGDLGFYVAIFQGRDPSRRPTWRVAIQHRESGALLKSVLARYKAVMSSDQPFFGSLEAAIAAVFNDLVKIVDTYLDSVRGETETVEQRLVSLRGHALSLRKLRKYMGAYDPNQTALPFEAPTCTSGGT